MNETNNDQSTESSQMSKSSPRFSTPMAILIVGVLIAGAIVYTKVGVKSAPAIAPGSAPTLGAAIDVKNVNTTNEPYIGDANAPVTIAYWSDYQCPFCKQFETQSLSPLITNYVNTHKVKIIFKDFQFLGPDSQMMALAARAIWETYPDKFFAWREMMFNSQGQENSGYGTKDKVIALIKNVQGIDANKISTLMDQNKDKYQKEIDDDKTEAAKYNINGTPGFVTGKQMIDGAVPYATFQNAIEAQLK